MPLNSCQENIPLLYRYLVFRCSMSIKPHANMDLKGGEKMSRLIVHLGLLQVFMDFVTPLRLTHASAPH